MVIYDNDAALSVFRLLRTEKHRKENPELIHHMDDALTMTHQQGR